jgi:hypothetical protein
MAPKKALEFVLGLNKAANKGLCAGPSPVLPMILRRAKVLNLEEHTIGRINDKLQPPLSRWTS